VKQLGGEGKRSEKEKSRLFEIFLQKEDMVAFSHDFREMQQIYGRAKESDPFDWSQFRMDETQDINRLEASLLKEGIRSRNMSRDPEAEADPVIDSDPAYQQEDVIIKGRDGEDDKDISLLDPANLVDSDGRVWSGVVLDTDIVQKTMPGNRMNTNRCLVMVGNLRGAGGFGMGKGKSPEEAMNSAFR
jgi:Ribosomal protein S5, N-terminal domain